MHLLPRPFLTFCCADKVDATAPAGETLRSDLRRKEEVLRGRAGMLFVRLHGLIITVCALNVRVSTLINAGLLRLNCSCNRVALAHQNMINESCGLMYKTIQHKAQGYEGFMSHVDRVYSWNFIFSSGYYFYYFSLHFYCSLVRFT